MASTQALKARIISTAKGEAQEIIERAKQEAQEMITKAKKKAQEEGQKILEKTKEENIQLMEREKTMAYLELRKKILAQKQEAIKEVFDQLKDMIKEMDDKTYQKIIQEMLLCSVETGKEEVILSKEDQVRLGKDFVKNINSQLKAKGKKGELKLSKETKNITGGFILKGVGVENNRSFGEILAIQRDDLEAQIAGILFKDTE